MGRDQGRRGQRSFNDRKGTVRGMYFQRPPHEEVKLVRCTRGALDDVIVDLRPDSPTLRRWIAVELSERNRRALYVPRGFADGFQTLADDTEVFDWFPNRYAPEAAGGARWDDPAFRHRAPASVGPTEILEKEPQPARVVRIDDGLDGRR